jgi:hypothetical protein
MCRKLSIMADAKVNEEKETSNFSDKDKERLLAEEGEQTQDYVTTVNTNNDSTMMWEAMINGLGKKLNLLAGTPNTCITDFFTEAENTAHSD